MFSTRWICAWPSGCREKDERLPGAFPHSARRPGSKRSGHQARKMPPAGCPEELWCCQGKTMIPSHWNNQNLSTAPNVEVQLHQFCLWVMVKPFISPAVSRHLVWYWETATHLPEGRVQHCHLQPEECWSRGCSQQGAAVRIYTVTCVHFLFVHPHYDETLMRPVKRWLHF